MFVVHRSCRLADRNGLWLRSLDELPGFPAYEMSEEWCGLLLCDREPWLVHKRDLNGTVITDDVIT